MSDKTYRLSPLAEGDLEDIWLYTLRHWSLDQADKYHRDLVSGLVALAAGVKRGRTSDARKGYFTYLTGAHVVYFQDRGDRLDIIRILHSRMDAGEHL